jgi:superfamily I DNA/RNA helicase
MTPDAVVNDNAMLKGLGGRALGFGIGEELLEASMHRVQGFGFPARDAPADILGSRLEAPDDDARWERMCDGWRSAVEAFDAVEPRGGVGQFLRHVALAQPVDSLPRGRTDGVDEATGRLGRGERVHLMTVHSAKGLEWDVVFLAGVEDDQFPLYRSKEQPQIAEERRLLYVGMTRARNRLFLFSVGQRDGRVKQPSRFLAPLFGKSIDIKTASSEGAAQTAVRSAVAETGWRGAAP